LLSELVILNPKFSLFANGFLPFKTRNMLFLV
jgi:hypothetical protein